MAGALLSCAHGGNAAPESSAATAPDEAADLIGQEVVAVVQMMEMNTHTETLTDGSIWVSNVVALAVEQPRRLGYMVMVHTSDLPRIGDRRVQLGDVVQFVLPRNWRHGDIAMEELENLRFRE